MFSVPSLGRFPSVVFENGYKLGLIDSGSFSSFQASHSVCTLLFSLTRAWSVCQPRGGHFSWHTDVARQLHCLGALEDNPALRVPQKQKSCLRVSMIQSCRRLSFNLFIAITCKLFGLKSAEIHACKQYIYNIMAL